MHLFKALYHFTTNIILRNILAKESVKNTLNNSFKLQLGMKKSKYFQNNRSKYIKQKTALA